MTHDDDELMQRMQAEAQAFEKDLAQTLDIEAGLEAAWARRGLGLHDLDDVLRANGIDPDEDDDDA